MAAPDGIPALRPDRGTTFTQKQGSGFGMIAMLRYRDAATSTTVGSALPVSALRTHPPGDRRTTRHRDTDR